ncbi:unnamed protein product [Phytophthora fragariaefolia]|uniref:Unnamed protein product n=1 Tax=Phytophthora fragariaefolia TaxID=1490495 RepID=A0A9W7CQ69_9STRA|nr:unnamed protein product [Phytophthora fragariaefolia]
MQVKYPIMGLSYARGLFAICGGGGSLKSGIKNTVTDPTGFSKEMTADTGLELASGVAFSHDGQLLAVSVSAGCWVYAVDVARKTLTLLLKFRSDFHEDESSQSCARFVGNSTILTGGEDGVVRVWKLSRDPSKLEKSVGSAKALQVEDRDPHDKVVTDEQPTLGDCVIDGANVVTLTREYRGHSKRIRDIDVDLSHRNLVATSAEDQSCHLWRLTEVTPICKFSKDDALDIASQRLPTKPVLGPRKHLFRCVRFANSGRRLYTVLTPARGDSVLIKWKPETIAQENEEQWSWVVEEAAIAGDKPVASLCVNQDDRFVCTAAVTGEIKVFLASTLQQYKKTSTEQHTFAITGMSFAPPADKQAPVFHVVSGGADKNLLRHDVPLEGGIVKSGMEIVLSGVKSAVGATVGLGLNLWMAATLLFILLLFIHAKTAMLLDGPLTGFNDLASLSLDSSDGLVTIAALLGSTVITWLFVAHSSVTNRFFWNALLCLLSGIVAFLVAISAELQVNWQTGDASVDELLAKAITVKSSSSDVTTTPIPGTAVVLQYLPPKQGCSVSSTSTMKLDSIGFSYSDDSQVENEERDICGAIDTMENVVCFSSGNTEDKTMMDKAKAVMRTQRTRDDKAIVTCTAWLWGNQGHIISNNHCFSSQEMVDAAKFEFDVQTTSCNEDGTFATCPVGKTLDGKANVKFIKSDANLDYSVLQITNDAASYVTTYGYLQIRSTAPTKEEHIYIPQQPKGGAKKIAKTDNDADTNAATVLNLAYSVAVEGVTYNHLLAYSADTEEGSSGSPVISRKDNAVVGLHRIGECDNAATPSDQLANTLKSIISGNDGIKTA